MSWNTKTQRYIGLPISFDMTMWHDDQFLDITSVNNISLVAATSGVTLVNGTAPATPAATSIYYTKSIVTITKNQGTVNEYSYKVARIQITALGADVPLVTDINVTTSAVYAGVTYERTLVHTINKSTDTNVYSLLPSVNEVVYDKNADSLSVNTVNCEVVCDSSDNKHYTIAYADFATHGIVMYYKKFYKDGTSDANETLYENSAISINKNVNELRFYLYGLTNGSVNRNIVHDTEGVSVVSEGEDATSYWFDSEVNAIPLDEDGNRKFSSFSVYLKKKKGENDSELCADFYLAVYRLSGSTYTRAQVLNSKASGISVVVASDKTITQYIVCAFASTPPVTFGDATPIAEIGIGVTVDGEPGETYTLISDIETIVRAYNGTYKSSSTPCITAWKKIGENDPVRLHDIVDSSNGDVAEGMTINAVEYSGNTIVHTNTPSGTGILTCTTPYSSADRIEVTLTKGGKTYAEKTISIITEQRGPAGADGVFPRDRGLFKSGESYYYIKSGDVYIRDKVNYEIGGVMYGFLVKEKDTTVTAAPTSASGDSNWEAAGIVETVIANTVFGTNANIGGFMASNQRLVSSNVAYRVLYVGSYSSSTTYETTTNSDNITIRKMVLYNDIYWTVRGGVTGFSGQTPSDTSAYWRRATTAEINAASATDNYVDIYTFTIDGIKNLIEMIASDDSTWSVDKNGIQTLGLVDGRRIELNPLARELNIYDDNGTLVTTLTGEAYASLAALFGDNSGDFTLSSGSSGNMSATNSSNKNIVNRNNGNTTAATIKRTVDGVTSEVPTTSTSRITVVGTIQAFATTTEYSNSNNSGTSTPIIIEEVAPITVDGYVTHHAAVYVYVRTYKESTHKTLIASRLIASVVSDGNGTKSKNINAKVDVPAGYQVISVEYENTVYPTPHTTQTRTNWNLTSASYVSDMWLSRLFANGLAYGSSQNNFFALMNLSNKLMMQAVTTDSSLNKHGFGLDSDGFKVQRKNVIGKVFPTIFYGVVTWSTKETFSISKVYSYDGYTPTLSRVNEGDDGKMKLTFPSSWSSLCLSFSTAIVNLVGYNDSVRNVHVTSFTSSQITIEGNDDTSNNYTSFAIEIKYIG